MYPYLRLLNHALAARRQGPLGLLDTHRSRHVCLPWDIDPWRELNNGRTLTLYDLGRIPLAMRTGLVTAMRREGWGLTLAGAAIRYRRRVRMFDRLDMRSRLIGWDDRFFYMDQSMWRLDGECASHAVFRGAVTGPGGIVPPARVLAALGRTAEASPALPDWVVAWLDAENARPWPPVDATPRTEDAA